MKLKFRIIVISFIFSLCKVFPIVYLFQRLMFSQSFFIGILWLSYSQISFLYIKSGNFLYFLVQCLFLFSDMIHQLPLLTERQYIATIHSRLQDSQPWKLPGLQATVRLAWALALRGISQLPDVTGKPLVGHFLMRNDVSAFTISGKV